MPSIQISLGTFLNVKSSKKDRDLSRWEIYKKVLGSSFFLITRLGSVMQVPLLQTKGEIIKKLPKLPELYLK